MDNQTLNQQISAQRIIPVIDFDDLAHSQNLIGALHAGGFTIVEMTLRRPNSLAILKEFVAADFDLVGAGSVKLEKDVDIAIEAGAQFLVSPGFSRKVVRRAIANNIPIFPGIASATEIMMALEEGISIVKFFPAEIIGGTKALKALAGPFPEIKFMPTGGIKAESAAEYLAIPAVIAIGGSWMASSDDFKSGDWAGIARKSQESLAAAKK